MFLITYFVCLTDVVFLFALHSTFRNFYIHADEEVTQTRHKKNEFFALLNNTSFVTSLSVSGSHFCSTSLCSRFFVTLALPKLLCLGNKIKKSFLFSLYYSLGSSTRVTRLFVTFTSMRMKKLLRLGIKRMNSSHCSTTRLLLLPYQSVGLTFVRQVSALVFS